MSRIIIIITNSLPETEFIISTVCIQISGFAHRFSTYIDLYLQNQLHSLREQGRKLLRCYAENTLIRHNIKYCMGLPCAPKTEEKKLKLSLIEKLYLSQGYVTNKLLV